MFKDYVVEEYYHWLHADSRRQQKEEVVLKPAVLKLWGLPESQNVKAGISIFLTDVCPNARSTQHVVDT